MPSAARTTAIGKYLVALSASLAASREDTGTSGENSVRKTASRGKQLHILYLLNDLLHHTRYHTETSAAYSTLTGNLQIHLVDLFGYASAYDASKFVRHHKKLNELLDIWNQKEYYHSAYIEKLRETVVNAARLGYNGGGNGSRPQDGTSDDLVGGAKKDAPFIMPAAHGDTSTPYYDLPAGNMMPHIVPNSSVPINPKLVKPLQFVAGPADEHLTAAVKEFMKDVESLYGIGRDEGEDAMDVDEMGQPIIRDEITGDLIEGESYYGWSRAFCERMKRRRDGKEPVKQDSRRSLSLDSRTSLQQRRRYSYSESSRSRSKSPIRSHPRFGGQDDHRRRRPRRGSGSSSRSQSRGRRGNLYNGSRSPRRDPSGRRSRTRSYSPERVQQAYTANLQPLAVTQVQVPNPAPLAFPNPFHSAPLGPNGLPTPPPPPLNYRGPWPPPPPPPPPQLQAQNIQYAPFSALVPPPPPPYPPPGADPSGPGAYQNGYVPIEQQNYFPAASVAWTQQQGTNSSSGAYGGRGGSYSSRGYRGGWS